MMTPERWQRIKDIFSEALDLPPDQRARFIHGASGNDQDLLREVESLLAAESGKTAESFLAGPAASLVSDALGDQEWDRNIGRRIGSWELVRLIGEGGMGAVYLAKRVGEFEQQAAFKLMQTGMDSRGIVSRFRYERQILARLEHPNIARLLEGGATEDGQPYFVMEYVEGEPIDGYFARHSRSVQERLISFLQACAAIEYAHQNLVVHRDLKPANILVTGDGAVKLLDFGIAKLLKGEASPEAAMLTQAGIRLMTPAYASPEQVRGEAVTTSTDVYSLGVILYQLLTGKMPYAVTGPSSLEMERSICLVDPPLPSHAESGKLARILKGDLDTIVMKALHKDPHLRYGSVQQLGADIERYLGGKPIQARPQTFFYRTRRFVGRNPVGSAAAALAVATLVAGSIAIEWQARIVASERDRARIEAAKAERINGFLQETLGYGNNGVLSQNLSKSDLKLSEVVTLAEKRAETELNTQPEVLAELQRTIGAIYGGQARYDDAERLLRSSLAAYTRLYGPNGRETAHSGHDLGVLLARKGKYGEAEPFLSHAVDVYREEARQGRPDAAFLAGALSDLGSVLGQEGKGDQGEAAIGEALQLAPQLSGQDRARVALMDNELAGIHYAKGDIAGAERLLRSAIDEYRRLPAGNYSEEADSIGNLGTMLVKQNKYAEAEPLLRESIDLHGKIAGDNPITSAGAKIQLSEALYYEGKYADAETFAREALETIQSVLPKDDARIASPLVQLGLILNKTGRSAEAEADLRRALDLRTHGLPAGNPLIAVTKGALGECLTSEKKYADAEPLLLDAYAGEKARLGEKASGTLEAVRRLNNLYNLWGKPKEAAVYRSLLP